MTTKELNRTGIAVSALGQGSWGMGGFFSSDASKDDVCVRALRAGIESGMTFIDTAEVYGAGHAEELIGRAAEGMRGKVFIATKFSPEHSEYSKVLAAAEGSLRRLKTDYIDLYQAHWPNPGVPVGETMRALEHLVSQGKVRHIGVSNFSLSQLTEAREALTKHDIVSNQVEYNLFDRSIEQDLLPYCEKEKISVIAYSPLDQGKIYKGHNGDVLEAVAKRYGKTPSQVILNWLLMHGPVLPIPKALSEGHIRENAAAADFRLSKEEFELISTTYARDPILVPVDEIEVSVNGEGARKVYQTKEEAVANKLNFCPSPLDLAAHIKLHGGENIKPVRLVRSIEKNSAHRYDLVEGRVRYWAWVLAFEGSRPVPAYVRE
jgi:diketogulonate reductase-like aldo/keto reductase